MYKSRIASSAAFAAAIMAAGLAGNTVVVRAGENVANATPALANGTKQPAERNKAPTQPEAANYFGTGAYFGGRKRRRAGYGWTNAHARRVARKARAVKRHRSSSKR